MCHPIPVMMEVTQISFSFLRARLTATFDLTQSFSQIKRLLGFSILGH
jgi:hypothetical protein